MALDTNNNLFTLAQAKRYLKSTGSTSDDDRITDIINYVSARFNSETNRLLRSRSITEYRDGDGTKTLLTNEYPLASTSVTLIVDTDREYNSTDATNSTNIILYSTEGKIVLDDKTFTAGDQSVKLTYTAGYTIDSDTGGATGSIPYDLQYAAKEMLRLMFNRERRNKSEIRSESVSGGSITYEDNMPWSVRQVLNQYRKRDQHG